MCGWVAAAMGFKGGEEEEREKIEDHFLKKLIHYSEVRFLVAPPSITFRHHLYKPPFLYIYIYIDNFIVIMDHHHSLKNSLINLFLIWVSSCAFLPRLVDSKIGFRSVLPIACATHVSYALVTLLLICLSLAIMIYK